MNKERNLERTKELVKKIVGYATDMMSSKFEYKIYYDKIQKQEVQYRSLKIELNNPNNFKSKRIKQTSFITRPKPGYYKIDYAYPELETKKGELKTLENQINIDRTKASLAHNRFTMNQTLLYRFIENLETEDLKNIIEYLDINMKNNYSGISSYDMTNTIYKSVTCDIGNLFECGIHVDLTEKYIGTITILEILIDHKEFCENFINKYIEIKEDFDATEAKLENSEILEKKLNEKINKIEKVIFNRIFEPQKLKQLKKDLKVVQNNISIFRGVCNFNREHALYPAKINRENSYSKYMHLSFYAKEMIDSLGEKSLYELIEKLNISIKVNMTNDNYFDESEEMRKALKKYFDNEERKIRELYNLSNNNETKEKPKILIK